MIKNILIKGVVPALFVALASGQLASADAVPRLITQQAGSLGTEQTVAVVRCRYQGSAAPARDASKAEHVPVTGLTEQMNTVVNKYYAQVAKIPPVLGGDEQAFVSFQFLPVPGDCQFGYPDNGRYDDRGVLSRELVDGITFADQAAPELMASTTRVVVVVDSSKRSFSTAGRWLRPLPNGGYRALSGTVVDGAAMEEPGLLTLVHGLGHQLGLPGLDLPLNQALDTGAAGQQGVAASKALGAYTRYAAQWIKDPGIRVLTITPPVAEAPLDVIIDLGLPNNRGKLTELIRLDINDAAATPGHAVPMSGYLLEVQKLASAAGDSNPAAVRVHRQTGGVHAAPASGAEGASAVATGPVTLCGATADSCGTVLEPSAAALREGDSFADAAAGIRVEVLGPNPDGGQRIRLHWAAAEQPNIVVTDLRLDSPLNGAGVFERRASYGDPIGYTLGQNWAATAPPRALPASVVPMVHTLEVELVNRGGEVSDAVHGSVYITEPMILAGPATSLTDIRKHAIATLPFTVPAEALPAAATANATVRIPYAPAGPFIAWVVVEGDNELANTQADNRYMESFVILRSTVDENGVYAPLELSLPVRNTTAQAQRYTVSITAPQPQPSQWTVRTTRDPILSLAAGASEDYDIRLQAPAPERPGRSGRAERLNLITWMAQGDAFVPVHHLPVYYRLVQPTHLTLEAPVDGEAVIRGQLSADGDKPLAGQPVQVLVSAHTGSRQSFIVRTDTNGRFEQAFQPVGDACQVVTAHFPGRAGYAAARSPEALQYFSAGCPRPEAEPVVISELAIKSIRRQPSAIDFGLEIKLSAPAPAGGMGLRLSGNAARYFRLPRRLRVPEGEQSLLVNIRRYDNGLLEPFIKVHLTVSSANNEKTMVLGRGRKGAVFSARNEARRRIKERAVPQRPAAEQAPAAPAETKAPY